MQENISTVIPIDENCTLSDARQVSHKDKQIHGTSLGRLHFYVLKKQTSETFPTKNEVLWLPGSSKTTPE